jgi:glyceraldehyde-3-phosphate dehydrogenase (NAD(P))
MRVAVLGMGIIGKRLADAIHNDPRLSLVGVGIRRPNAAVLARPDVPYFHTDTPDGHWDGVHLAGGWHDALAQADLVVDAGPSRSGAGRAGAYDRHGVPVRYCGGERSAALGPVVHSGLNHALGHRLRSARLPSCNTTALGRLVAAIGVHAISRLEATVVRCCTDSDKAAKGVTTGAVFDARPSHHAADLRAVVPGLDVASVVMTVPMVSGHVIHASVWLREPGADEIAGRLAAAPRVAVLGNDQGHDTAVIKTEARLSGAPRGDRYSLAVQVYEVDPARVNVFLSLDNEAITVPETLDALCGYADNDACAVRDRTDLSLLGQVTPPLG